MRLIQRFEQGMNIFRGSAFRERLNELVDAVNSITRSRSEGVSADERDARSDHGIPVEITDFLDPPRGEYEFREVISDGAGGWDVRENGLTHEDLGHARVKCAFRQNVSRMPLIGHVVYIKPSLSLDEDGVQYYEFEPPAWLIPVSLKLHSGENGVFGQSKPTWKYDVYTLDSPDNRPLIEAAEPLNNRDECTYTQATAGYAYRNSANVWQLGWVNEEIDLPMSDPPPPPYVPGPCTEGDILRADANGNWVCLTPVTQTVLTGVSWNASTAQLEFTRETLTVIEKAGGVADTDIQFYDCDGNTP